MDLKVRDFKPGPLPASPRDDQHIDVAAATRRRRFGVPGFVSDLELNEAPSGRHSRQRDAS
jgi:hypothetical protein